MSKPNDTRSNNAKSSGTKPNSTKPKEKMRLKQKTGQKNSQKVSNKLKQKKFEAHVSAPEKISPEKLCRKLDYKFNNAEHLYLALTHRSASGHHNERSEFLGDSVLNFIIAHALYELYPKAPEGDLSRYRATLVKKDALAEIARELELGNYIRLGSGELKSGGYRRDSILADTVEAIIAAVLLDAGFDAAKSLVLRLYEKTLKTVTEVSIKDPKSRLQEFLQSRKFKLPVYTVTAIEGEAHDQFFEVLCEIPEFELSITGKGRSRRSAEQIAAEQALEIIAHKK